MSLKMKKQLFYSVASNIIFSDLNAMTEVCVVMTLTTFNVSMSCIEEVFYVAEAVSWRRVTLLMTLGSDLHSVTWSLLVTQWENDSLTIDVSWPVSCCPYCDCLTQYSVGNTMWKTEVWYHVCVTLWERKAEHSCSELLFIDREYSYYDYCDVSLLLEKCYKYIYSRRNHSFLGNTTVFWLLKFEWLTILCDGDVAPFSQPWWNDASRRYTLQAMRLRLWAGCIYCSVKCNYYSILLQMEWRLFVWHFNWRLRLGISLCVALSPTWHFVKYWCRRLLAVLRRGGAESILEVPGTLWQSMVLSGSDLFDLTDDQITFILTCSIDLQWLSGWWPWLTACGLHCWVSDPIVIWYIRWPILIPVV